MNAKELAQHFIEYIHNTDAAIDIDSTGELISSSDTVCEFTATKTHFRYAGKNSGSHYSTGHTNYRVIVEEIYEPYNTEE